MTDDSFRDAALEQMLERVGEPMEFKGDPDRGWARVAAGVGESRSHVKREAFSLWSLRRWVGYSSVVAVIGLFAIVLVVATPFVLKKMDTSRTGVIKREYSTRHAQRATIDLPDGTQVILAPESRLNYAATAQGDRTIDLQGQGYFTVVHTKNRAFVVRTDNITTRVLGTSFSVRKYPVDSIAQIAVAEGRVSVGTNSKPSVLVAGDVAKVNSVGAAAIIHNARIADAFGWTRGELVFNDARLKDVAIELERAYGLEITIADTVLGNHLVTATFANQTSESVMTELAAIVGAKYSHSRNSNKVVLARIKWAQ